MKKDDETPWGKCLNDESACFGAFLILALAALAALALALLGL